MGVTQFVVGTSQIPEAPYRFFASSSFKEVTKLLICNSLSLSCFFILLAGNAGGNNYDAVMV
jgi:hypothetical protein